MIHPHRLALIHKLGMLALLFAFVSSLGACSSKPEKELVEHIKAMDKILADNMDSPKEGLEKARAYMHDNLPSMMKQGTKMVLELQKIEDDDARKERAKAIVDEVTGPATTFAGTLTKFQAKVAEDKEAQKYLEDIQKRYMGLFLVIGAMGGGLG